MERWRNDIWRVIFRLFIALVLTSLRFRITMVYRETALKNDGNSKRSLSDHYSDGSVAAANFDGNLGLAWNAITDV